MAAPPDAEKGERSATRKPGRQVPVNDPARGILWGPPGPEDSGAGRGRGPTGAANPLVQLSTARSTLALCRRAACAELKLQIASGGASIAADSNRFAQYSVRPSVLESNRAVALPELTRILYPFCTHLS
jgi:hypothetical protein